MKFSERMGIVPIDRAIQTEGMTESLRTSVWNVLDMSIWSTPGFQYRSSGTLGQIDALSRDLWFNYFKKRIDARPDHAFEIIDEIRDYFFECAWYEVYELVEYLVQGRNVQQLVGHINEVLERELAGFRIISGYVVPITEAAEKEAIEQALQNEKGPFSGARAHLIQALEHLSNRENPDYRNSIKESISAVESLACELSGSPKATLGDALRVLEKEGQLHGALRSGLSAIYGYTSDAEGIRHAMLEEATVDAADAKYFLVACSAFVNYLKEKHAKAT